MPKPAYNPDKFRELLLYLAERSENDPKFGETKLNKLLFYADFVAYRELGKPITGARYHKLEWGPAAVPFVPIERELQQSGELVVRRNLVGSKVQKKPIALRGANLDRFSGAEIALVEQLLEELREYGGRQVSDLSHETPAWKVAAYKEDIPYETAFVESIELVGAAV